MNQEEFNELEKVGLKPIVIDENTVLNTEGKSLEPVYFEFNEEDYPIELDKNGRPKKTVRNKRAVGVRNKAAGHGWEYKLIDYLKGVGFLDVVSTRGNSKFLDAQKIDIMNKDERTNGFLPFNLQAKTGSAPNLYQGVFADMPKNGVPNVIAFKYTRKAKSKFMTVGEYALMEINTWLYYIEVEKKYKELLKLEELAKQHNKLFENGN